MKHMTVASIDPALLSGVLGGGIDQAKWDAFKKQASMVPGAGDLLDKAEIPKTPEEAQALGEQVIAKLPSFMQGMAKGMMSKQLASLFPKGAGTAVT